MYSFLLVLACVAAAIALTAALATWSWAARSGFAAGRARRLMPLAGWSALALLVLATAVHVGWDHRPGTDRALGALAFLREHPALLVVAGIAILALALRRRATPEG